MIGTLLIYFLAGVGYDMLVTMYYAAVIDGKVMRTAFFSAITTGVAYGVVYLLTLTPNAWMNILAYALGCGFGAGMVVWSRNGKENT